jgi:hypothetical protein
MNAENIVAAELGLNTPDRARRAAENLLDFDTAEFRSKFNRLPFGVRHNLAGHPLFTLHSLLDLTRRLPPHYTRYSSGEMSVDDGLFNGKQTGLSVEETIRQIEECGSWMTIRFVHDDPAYGALMNQLLDQIRPFSEELAPDMVMREAFIFVSSPNAVTPYHIDPEYNFLLQVRGSKTIHIFDRSDPEILTELDFERYLSDGFTQIEFKPEYQAKAISFDLRPGYGAHVPLTTPHWVKNGPEVSISFSITFRTPYSERLRMIHSANAFMRRNGVTPSSIGKYPVRDSLKYQIYRSISTAKLLFSGKQAREGYKS